jgi:hypothetical protein
MGSRSFANALVAVVLIAGAVSPSQAQGAPRVGTACR